MDWLANEEYTASANAGQQPNDWQDKLLVDLSAGIELKPINWSFIWGLRKICRSNENIHRVFNGIGSESPNITTPGFKSKKPMVWKNIMKDGYGMSTGFPSAEGGAPGLSNFSPEIYLTFIYLVTLYHIRFGVDAKRVKQDTANFQYCLKEYDRRLVPHLLPKKSDKWPSSQYSGVLDRLAFEMIKADISARSFDLQGDILRRPWSDAKYEGTYFELSERSQYAAYELWGPNLYPTEEIQDDLETNRAQELHAWSHYKRYEVALLRNDMKDGLKCELEIERLLLCFLEHMTKYMQLIHYATQEHTSSTTNTRLISWARYAVAHFYAAALDFHRVAYPYDNPLDSSLASAALEGILVIALKVHETEGDVALMRIAWPLLLAGMETRVPFQQNWVMERFDALAGFGVNFTRAADCLKKVVSCQKEGGPRIDFLSLIQMKHVEEFVLH